MIRSLAYRTDIMVLGDLARVEERDGYRVVTTPSMPDYYWGNFILFDAPPDEGAIDRWPAIFSREHRSLGHMACGWDDPMGAQGRADRFVATGWTLDRSVALVASRIDAPAPTPGLTLRPIRGLSEWDAVCENQLRCRSSHAKEVDHRLQRRLSDHFRASAEAGHGEWFGAFLGDVLVADLGIYVDRGVGRFQAVETHPAHRRERIASALIRWAAHHAFDRMGVRELVILAQPDTFVAELYASLGFVERERAAGVYRTAPPDRLAP